MMKSRIDINSAMSICLRAGVKVHPVVSGKSFVIHVDNNGKWIKYTKKVTDSEVARSVSKVYKYYAKRILNRSHANQT